MNLYSLLGQLQSIGFYDVVLPWVLFFAVAYAILYKYGPFDDNMKKQISGIVAFALAFFAVAYTPYGTTMATFLTSLFGQGSTILALLLLATILAGMLGIDLSKKAGGDYGKYVIAAIILIGLAIYYYSGPVRTMGLGITGLLNSTTILTLLVLAGIGYLVYWMLGGGGNSNSGSNQQAQQQERSS